MSAVHRLRIAIIGAGPGGICAGVHLRAAGFDDFVILEKSDGVGGTWQHNRYPGAECDVPSHLYSFSFELKPDWSKPYGRQAEIRAYMQACVERHGLTPHLRLNTEVRRATWNDASSLWHVETAAGEVLEVDVVISALGMFNELYWPDIPGLDGFEGTRFHSARWNHDHDLSGETVGVIGSAASAVQFVPEIAPRVARLHVYQRSANWVLPKEDDPYTPEQIEAFRADPEALRRSRDELLRQMDGVVYTADPVRRRKAEEAGLAAIAVVADSDLRRKLTPKEPWGCKRPLFANPYYPTFNRPNVELVTEPIERITSDAIVTSDGKARRADTLILATGFQTTRFLSAIDVVGRGGRKLDLAWSDGAQAYLGITTSGFPNLFMLYGPNTNQGSILYMIECQVEYVLRQLQRLRDENLAWLDVRPEVMERYNAELQRDIADVEVWQAGCNSYYRSASGRVVTQWPHSMNAYRQRTSQRDPEAYEVVGRSYGSRARR
jgi:cation diffusion facilitator CzcD-associated flavoprotein CzcO